MLRKVLFGALLLAPVAGVAQVFSSIVTGQAVIATTGTAVQLSAAPLSSGLIVKALSTNVASIEVGGAGVTNVSNGTGNGYIIKPGEAGSFAVSNSSLLYVNGSAGDIVTFEGN